MDWEGKGRHLIFTNLRINTEMSVLTIKLTAVIFFTDALYKKMYGFPSIRVAGRKIVRRVSNKPRAES